MSVKHLVKTLGLALVAVLAFGVVAAAAASAHTFVAEPTGGVFPSEVTATGGLQTFTTAKGTVKCEKATATGQALKKEEETTIQKVEYSGKCEAEEKGGFKLKAPVKEPIKAEYEFTAAGNKEAGAGKVKILKEILLELGGFANCNIKVRPQGPLTGLTYVNEANGTLKTEANVGKIIAQGAGGFCGTAEEEDTYVGTATAKLAVGGKLEVK